MHEILRHLILTYLSRKKQEKQTDKSFYLEYVEHKGLVLRDRHFDVFVAVVSGAHD